MAKSPNWSEEELNILKEYYPTLGGCQKLLDMLPKYRNLQGMRLKANRLGLKVTNNIRKGSSVEEYTELIKESNFILSGIYTNRTTPAAHTCKHCGIIRDIRPQQILNGSTYCPSCNNTRKLTQSHVDTVLNTAGFLRISTYTGTLDKITLKHINCGYIWDTKYSYIEQGSGCPKCNKGFGYLVKDDLPEVAYLYLLEILLWGGETFLKIGVTSRDISKRISSLYKDLGELAIVIKPIIVLQSTGKNILEAEDYLLSNNKKHNTNLRFAGYTELLDVDSMPSVLKYMEELKYDKIV